jgi:hypothetical protein
LRVSSTTGTEGVATKSPPPPAASAEAIGACGTVITAATASNVAANVLLSTAFSF